jgi:hypothetical protein
MAETEEKVNPEEEVAAFASGFYQNKDMAEEVPVEAPSTVPESPVVDETPVEETTTPATEESVDTATPQQDEVPAPDVVFTQRLESMEANMRQRFDTAFGKMGGIERDVKEMKQRKDPPVPPPLTSPTLTSEDFAELAEEYPEITNKIVAGFNAGIGRSAPPVPTPPPELVSPAANGFITQEQLDTWQVAQDQKSAVQFMGYLTPDWQTVVGRDGDGSPYRAWLATQPETYQQQLAGTWDPREIQTSIGLFQTATAPKPAKPAAREGQTRRDIVRAAIPAKGTSGTPTQDVSEHEAFMQGFNKRR